MVVGNGRKRLAVSDWLESDATSWEWPVPATEGRKLLVGVYASNEAGRSRSVTGVLRGDQPRPGPGVEERQPQPGRQIVERQPVEEAEPEPVEVKEEEPEAQPQQIVEQQPVEEAEPVEVKEEEPEAQPQQVNRGPVTRYGQRFSGVSADCGEGGYSGSKSVPCAGLSAEERARVNALPGFHCRVGTVPTDCSELSREDREAVEADPLLYCA